MAAFLSRPQWVNLLNCVTVALFGPQERWLTLAPGPRPTNDISIEFDIW